jgi:hypothetical protein
VNSAVSLKKVSKESKEKLSLVHIGENHGTCEETGKQHVKKGYRFRDKKITEDLWLLGKFIKTAGI